MLSLLILATTLSFSHENPLPPRIQWNANHGYCGEVSLITAGLYYGQYCSQYTARALASPDIPQSCRKSQLLIGKNDQKAANAMKLDAIEYDTDDEESTDDFLAWVKKECVNGYPVAIGLFNNEYLFYGKEDPDAGDKDYDHIVTVFRIDSEHTLTDPAYYPDDQIYFHDHGFWADHGRPHFVFFSSFQAFQKDRQEANRHDGPIYSLNNDASNYGIATTGVLDPGHHTIPVRLTTNTQEEVPHMGHDSNEPPPSAPVELTAVVTLPDPEVGYNLYLYDAFDKVPMQDFNAHADQAVQHWKISPHSGATYTVKLSILSNQIAAFRAVAESAP